GETRRRRRLGHRRNLLGGSARVAAEKIETAICGDSIEPRPERGTALELTEATPGREQGLLEHVFGVLQRAEDPIAVQLKLAPGRGRSAPGRPARRRHGRGLATARTSAPTSSEVLTPSLKETNRPVRGRDRAALCYGAVGWMV